MTIELEKLSCDHLQMTADLAANEKLQSSFKITSMVAARLDTSSEDRYDEDPAGELEAV